MQFQISSKRKNRKRDTWVIIRISILRKSFYQTILLHQIQRETPQGCWIEDQTNLCWEHCYEFAKSPENQVSGKGKTIVLLVYTSLAASKTACLNCSFRLRRFTLLVQTKKMISISYGAPQTAGNQTFSHNQAFFKKLKNHECWFCSQREKNPCVINFSFIALPQHNINTIFETSSVF